ncbi:MAG TPA: patatin-like phospholipase family protein [Acidocella sp.]|jgi:predicted acylesterase/phospholipase RssA|nr:patatin-like phospholipase family protein [Acidocella sp.]
MMTSYFALSRRRFLGAAGFAGMAPLLPGCATPTRLQAVPVTQTTEATVLGLPNERFFPLHGAQGLDAEFYAALQRRNQTLGLELDALPPPIELLAVSGGGEDGAFGAGLLCGWTQAGTRPVFELVTGVSTGALTAPFAFLGSAYDPQLRHIYTGIKPSNVLEQRNIISGAIFSDALANNAPLFGLISTYMNTDMQAAIAQAYQQGRLLLIGTTNLDAQVPVIWNIGAMAASNNPRALDTIRRLLLASAAIPGAFPPTMIDVTVDGVPYQEMHVDGGAFAQAFLYPPSVTVNRRARIKQGKPVVGIDAYIIRNARLDPDWASVRRRTLSIAGRAIGTLLAANGANDVLRLYYLTKHDDVDYNLAYIGADFTEEIPTPFDPGYMNDLFNYGYQHAVHGYNWAKQPPAAWIGLQTSSAQNSARAIG